MEIEEQFVSHIVQRAVEKCGPELRSLGRDLSVLEKIKPPFPRISTTSRGTHQRRPGADGRPGTAQAVGDAVGHDFGAPHETCLTQQFEKPLFVYGYPTAVKAFYMEPWPGRPEVSKSVDLLAPEGYGEIIGGGQRISDPELLLQRIHDHKLPEEAYKWYIDLRRYGSVPHSGFGLGVERTVTWICGIDHLREAIAYPRMINRMYP
jgi:asparaginyl-tRNA synthetase